MTAVPERTGTDAQGAVADDDEATVALALAAKATAAWFGGSDRSLAFAALRDAMAHTARVTHGRTFTRKPSEFLALLRTPVKTWLGVRADETLVEHGAPSAYSLDVIAETGVGDTDEPEAELVQSRVGDARATFALRSTGDAEYAAFREFLIEHGHGSRVETQQALAPSGLRLTDLYEDIPAACRVHGREGDVFFPCPVCGWPMLLHETAARCQSPYCVSEGASFSFGTEGGELVALGKKPAPDAIPADGRVRLRRGPWRYTLLPGLVELDLAKRLERIRGVKVTLWPERDRYDLHVKAADTSWRVDVKDWSNAIALADRLRRAPPEVETHVVVPDHRRHQLPLLRERLVGSGWRFASVSGFVAAVRNAVRREGRGHE